MSNEHGLFRDWLLTQSPEEILKHTCKYAVQQEMLGIIENLKLPDEQVAALLASSISLDDLYKDYCIVQTNFKEIIMDCLELHARDYDLCWQNECHEYQDDSSPSIHDKLNQISSTSFTSKVGKQKDKREENNDR